MTMRSAVATATGVLLGVSALTFTVTPAQAVSRQDLGHSPPLTIAHRGASGYAPENTLASINLAHKLGFNWVENDVQRTKDGQLVVIHDTTLARTTNVEQLYPNRSPWNVSDFTAKEIARLDAGSWFSDDYTGERIPTLKQYLEDLDKTGQSLLLELKNPELYPGVELQTLKELGNEGWLDSKHLQNRLIVQSFNADAIREAHLLKPALKTGFLGTPKVSELKEYGTFSDQINTAYTGATKSYVNAVHAQKGPHGKPMKVFAWTVNDASTARSLAGSGVDGIITNYPDVIRDATHN